MTRTTTIAFLAALAAAVVADILARRDMAHEYMAARIERVQACGGVSVIVEDGERDTYTCAEAPGKYGQRRFR